jgi:hypothetical protein
MICSRKIEVLLGCKTLEVSILFMCEEALENDGSPKRLCSREEDA